MYSNFIIDVARPDEDIKQLDYLDYRSELVFDKLKPVMHQYDNIRYKTVAFTIPDDRFINKGYNLETLK